MHIIRIRILNCMLTRERLTETRERLETKNNNWGEHAQYLMRMARQKSSMHILLIAIAFKVTVYK